MKKNIFVSGIINLEHNVPIGEFPISYSPIEYIKFGIETSVGGVGFNIAKAMTTLGDEVSLNSFLGKDVEADTILAFLQNIGIKTNNINRALKATPSSVALFSRSGQRKILCDLKDSQDTFCDFSQINLSPFDLIIATNINFNRPLLKYAKSAGKIIATDVHVISSFTQNGYNEDFMQATDILFMSDEGIRCKPEVFLSKLSIYYPAKIMVIGQGQYGAMMYVRQKDKIYHFSPVQNKSIKNTIGAGDALFSSFNHFYINGYSEIDALKRAEIFASRKISFNGASKGFLTHDEVEQCIQESEIIITELPVTS